MLTAANAPIVTDSTVVADLQVRYRAMPRDVSHSTYLANKEFYDRIGSDERLKNARSSVVASALLIGACQDNQLSADGNFNGVFTGKLKLVWNGGKFNGNYLTFHANIMKLMPPNQTPNLFWATATDQAFRVAARAARASGQSPYDFAKQELLRGVAEVPGPADNPRIVLYHSTTVGGAAPDEVSWCSSFVNFCVEQAGMKGTNNKAPSGCAGKRKVGVGDPFELHAFAVALHDQTVNPSLAAQPRNRKTGFGKDRGIAVGNCSEPGVAVLENIGVVGKARSIAVDGNATGHIAVGTALAGKKAQ